MINHNLLCTVLCTCDNMNRGVFEDSQNSFKPVLSVVKSHTDSCYLNIMIMESSPVSEGGAFHLLSLFINSNCSFLWSSVLIDDIQLLAKILMPRYFMKLLKPDYCLATDHNHQSSHVKCFAENRFRSE